jgi:crotonobetainyl-CoA:carnitine CoA-transferase CaiB-like acyl-CoA transferase
MSLPLEGIKILESAHQYPGPYCSMLLADLGAEVLKVERPGVGDLARQVPPFFQSINRNKKSLTLNLKAPGAREILHQLVKRYDVFMEGFRPGVAERLGMDYPTLRQMNPRIIYCSISGYGQEGPYRDWPGHDLNYQAMAGMLQCFKDEKGDFLAPRLSIADLSSGMFAAVGILAALLGREKTERGRYIDISVFDGLLSWMSARLGIFFGAGQFDLEPDAGYGIFKAGDGQAFTLGIAHEDWFWDRLCSAVGLPEFKGLNTWQRRQRRKELVDKLQRIFMQKTRDAWIQILVQADVPVSPVQTFERIPQDLHVIFREMIQEISLSSGERIKQTGIPFKMSEMPGKIRTPVPQLGEHTREVLESLGYSLEEIERLKKDGAI